MPNLIRTQMRVIGAIAVREINAQQTSLMYGYAWSLVDVGLSVLGLCIMKLVLRAFNPPGLPPATFVLTGALPWFLFSALYHNAGPSIARNRKLLSLPAITELDLIFGASVQLIITYTIAFIIATVISSYFEHSGFPKFFLGVCIMYVACIAMGISFGMVMMLLGRVYSPAGKFISFFMRFALFLSSVYMPITRFPTYIWPYLIWNPMLQIEELIRQYWFPNYVSPVGSPFYIAECILGMVALGLLCERYTRVRMPLT